MRYFICILLCFLLSACVTPITLHKKSLSDSKNPKFKLAKKSEYIVSSFLFGLVSPSKKIKVWKKCPANWQTLKISRSFFHILTAGLTLGIYTPFKVIITCYIRPKKSVDEFEQFKDSPEDLLEDIPEDLLEDINNNQDLKL